MTPGPELTTDRLILRRWRPEDRAPFAAMNADPEVMRHVGDGSPLTGDESDALVDRIESGFDQHGFGLWAAVERESDRFVGFVGLAVPTFLPEILPAVEIGWRLARYAWGRGYATEGARAAARFAFEEAGLDRIVSICHPDNAASLRVMDKLGMEFDRDTVIPLNGVAARVMALDKEAWLGARR